MVVVGRNVDIPFKMLLHCKTILILGAMSSIPRTKLNHGMSAFPAGAPGIWNELPTTLKPSESLSSFRTKSW